MMPKANYSLNLNDLFTHHGLQSSGLLHDADLHLSQMQVEALVASGDCFVTLATELDNIAETLIVTDPNHTKLELEKLTRILLYLQQHYKVAQKT
jgi:hypothetical protein